MNLLKIGDRVRISGDSEPHNGFKTGETGVILNIDMGNPISYFIALDADSYWFYHMYVELDVQYYRDKKINQILK